MTTREPDRFDKQAREFKARFWRIESGWDKDMDEEDIAAALRAEHASALERAAQRIREVYEMGYRDCERHRDRNPDRALIPPAAAPAAETLQPYCELAPAAETGKAQGAEAREPNGLDDVPSVPASTRCPICGSWETHQHRYDEVLKHRERLRRKARSPAAFPFDNGAEEEHRADLEILWRALTEATARIAELERDHRLYAEWAASEFGRRAWQSNESYDEWQARIAARVAPPDGEGK